MQFRAGQSARNGDRFASFTREGRSITMGTAQNVSHLNSFLRGEISAVETYQIALSKIDASSPSRAQLESCLASHQQRVSMLRDAIQQLGGEAATSSGAWGTFAKAVEGGAKVLGEKVAIAALEEGEDHGLRDYRDDLSDLDATARRLVETQLLPQQVATHRTMSQLKKQLH
jgi:demethoxyubiquinone hydroxylase (CLK1/Coq7/Cat5 family)